MSVTGTCETPVFGIVRSDLSSEDLSTCPLTPVHIQKLIETLKGLVSEFRLLPYDISARTGELKHVIIVSNHDATQGIVRFILRSSESIPRIKKLIAPLSHKHPWVTVVSCNVQPIPAAILEGPEETILTEATSIEERYNNISLTFSPQSFIQVTHEIAEALYGRVATFVQEHSSTNALDLFCGVGGFSLSIAPHVSHVTGVEVTPTAVTSAATSAKRLGLTNTTFLAGDVEEFLRAGSFEKPDLIVANPPRRGLSQGIREHLLSIAPDTIVYSSCDPTTFARDLAHLTQGYTLDKVALFDMFAMSDHCEVLGVLRRR
jgi:23S rRNA (uracil747-C5)-methyltransferase